MSASLEMAVCMWDARESCFLSLHPHISRNVESSSGAEMTHASNGGPFPEVGRSEFSLGPMASLAQGGWAQVSITILISKMRKLRPREGRILSKDLSPGLRDSAWAGTQLHSSQKVAEGG